MDENMRNLIEKEVLRSKDPEYISYLMKTFDFMNSDEFHKIEKEIQMNKINYEKEFGVNTLKIYDKNIKSNSFGWKKTLKRIFIGD